MSIGFILFLGLLMAASVYVLLLRTGVLSYLGKRGNVSLDIILSIGVVMVFAISAHLLASAILAGLLISLTLWWHRNRQQARQFGKVSFPNGREIKFPWFNSDTGGST